MVLVKSDHKLEQCSFVFDDAGNIEDVLLTVSYLIADDATGISEARIRKEKTVWADLTAAQKSSADSIGKRLKVLAEAL